jgi:hypothetical protein
MYAAHERTQAWRRRWVCMAAGGHKQQQQLATAHIGVIADVITMIDARQATIC